MPQKRTRRTVGKGSSHPVGAQARSPHPTTSPHRKRARRERTASVEEQSEPAEGLRPSAAAPILSEKQRRHLRGLAHPLKPVIRLGNSGLTDGVVRETDRALHDHELIKVKAAGAANREARDAAFRELATRTASALVDRIGHIAVLYRPRSDLTRILLPDPNP